LSRGRGKPQDADPRVSTRVPRASIWTSSLSFRHLIYIRRCLLRFEFLCRAISSHCQVRSVNLDRASIIQPLAGASSSSSSAASPDQDSADDYPEIMGIPCWNSAKEGRLIIMVAPTRAPSHNSSSRYPTIGRSEASDARTPNDGMIHNLNMDFNAMWLQTIMESIQCMTLEVSPLVALAQQGAETVNYVIAQQSVSNPRGEPSVGNRSNDRVKRARGEAAALTSGNCRLADNDTCRRITQNHQMREYGRDRDDLRNVIDDQRRLRVRSVTSP
jgi:hypothetical protein